MAISSVRSVEARVLEMVDLARALPLGEEVPLLVLRVPMLERIAWREGRGAARALERRCLRSFVEISGVVLRATDLLAHDAGSELFVAALVALPRDPRVLPWHRPADCRAVLERLSAAMERESGAEIERGWIAARDYAARDPGLSASIAEALERGARERERYAFFSLVGHELRTPLTSIRGYLETLLDDETLERGDIRRFLRVARDESLRLGRLVDGMFALSLLDLHGPSAHGESEIARTVDAAIDVLLPSASARGMRMRGECARLRVAMHEDRLMHVLTNLLENAIKHGHCEGSVVASARAIDEHWMELRVDDDGPGVPLAERDAIFALAARGSTRAPGTGIGLAVARLLVERTGGEIRVGDSPLGGASFRVRLPLATTSAREAACSR